MSKKKILILTDDMPWGHRSIARAIYNFLEINKKENDFEVFLREIKVNIGAAGDLYTFAYRYSPKSTKIFFNFSKNKLFRDLVEDASRLNLSRLKREIDKIKPDLIISTHVFHTLSLARWKQREKKIFKLWEVVTDPWTINPLCFVKEADLNIVYDNVSFKEGQKWGLKKENMMITGWWVRPEMYGKFNGDKVKKDLGFTGDRPIIFIGGGSLGMNALPKLLPAILTLKEKVAFIINTGTDKLALKLVKNFVRVLKRVRKDDLIQIKYMGWIDNMAEVLAGCDIVFGKAGPNFLFDCVAAKKPFVAITHIGGQEDGNIDLIGKKKLGWVKEKNSELLKFLGLYLEKPKYFETKFKKSIDREAANNRDSLKKILERIKRELF